MAEPDEGRNLRAGIETMRRELAEMRAEQRELARSIEQLTATFRTLAIHLGIGVEPYKKRSESSRTEDLRGFG